MGRKATSITEQIALLKQRGMNFDLPDKKVKEILSDIGYYRLGFYWHPFEKDSQHNFKGGTKFSNAVLLYYLDVDLRNLLICYINRIEVNFRTNVVYTVSNNFKNTPTWFISSDIMNQKFINNIDQHYNSRFIKENKPLKLHHKKYLNDRYAPAWKTLEFFTFGAILRVYRSLKEEEIKKEIASRYSVHSIKKFANLMGTVVFIRNYCAHGNILFDLKTPKGISRIPQIDFYENNRHSLDSAIRVISFILGCISNNRKKDLLKDYHELIDKHLCNLDLREVIENKMGYENPEY